ncbi:MAG: ribonuclease HI family protein [Nitrospirota bacterium]
MPEPLFNNKGMQTDLFGTVDPPEKIRKCAVMHCDGASSGNPGESGIGVVIDFVDHNMQCGKISDTHRISEYIGIATNNIAEYTAFIRGIEKARSLGIERINIFLDSELLVRQINGIYKVKNEKLIPLWVRAINVLKEFDEYSVVHIRREKNTEADMLARQAVKKKTGI